MATDSTKWIEVFHSKPSMKNCYLLEKLATGDFTKPSLSNKLRDASHVRAGFRVFRLPFRRIEFVLTNGTDRNWEDNNGHNYVIDVPGRYVIEHGIRRVDDADATQCFQTLCRPSDRFVQLEFRADLWPQCYCSYQKHADEWTPAPGEKMHLLEKEDAPGRYFQIVLEATRLACAFNDGGENWDSNLRNNYLIGCPGKYIVTDGKVKYIAPSDNDLDREPNAIPIETLSHPPNTSASTIDNALEKVAEVAQ